ncbi:MAG TPA: hypothetical protein VJ714_04445 [Anaerolineae bacterium]|nr:hypothetical protein [Anaerolineae bacterium]
MEAKITGPGEPFLSMGFWRCPAKMVRGCILGEMAVPDVERAQLLRAVKAKWAFGGSPDFSQSG